MVKFINGIRAALGFEKAYDFVTEGKDIEAEELFEKFEKISPKIPIEQTILKGLIKFRLRKHNEAIVAFESAWNKIEEATRLPHMHKVYLRLYISDLAILSSEMSGMKLRNIRQIDWTEVVMSEVDDRLKKRFPNRDHPDY